MRFIFIFNVKNQQKYKYRRENIKKQSDKTDNKIHLYCSRFKLDTVLQFMNHLMK